MPEADIAAADIPRGPADTVPRHRAIVGIDIARFAAALLVTFYHLGFKAFSVADEEIHLQLGGAATTPSWWWLTWFGWCGVQVFFVISGFVIAFSSENATGFSFLRSRITRLAPAMWICAAMGATVLLLWGDDPVTVGRLYVRSALFWPIGPWIGGQFWTLGVEIVFYAMILGLIVSRSFDRLAALTYAIALACALYWTTICLHLLSLTFLPRLTTLLLLHHGCYFALGTAIWLMWRRGPSVGLGLTCALCLITAIPEFIVTCAFEAPGPVLKSAWYVPYAIWLLITGGIAVSVARAATIAALIGGLAGSIRWLGLMTYPLYLLHVHVGGAVLVLALRHQTPSWLAVVLAIGVSIAAAFLVTWRLEPPLRRLLSRAITVLAERWQVGGAVRHRVSSP
jgi:peptidoglycan/LPS O-acetylase OafA/YrhL